MSLKYLLLQHNSKAMCHLGYKSAQKHTKMLCTVVL